MNKIKEYYNKVITKFGETLHLKTNDDWLIAGFLIFLFGGATIITLVRAIWPGAI
jgi:hypothetical protein